MKDYYVLEAKTTVRADRKMNNSTVKTLWERFCLGDGALTVQEGENCTFVLGSTALPALSEGKEFSIRIDENGAAVVGADYNGLVRGYFALLMKIEYLDGKFCLKHCEEESHYVMKNRMIHICVFPDNTEYFIKRLLRLIGLCQYTHVVIEFWGTLQYDCLKELAWPEASFTKAQVREWLREVREMGVEPIPMFNQLGHAAACRVRHGKHVVLDQNPRLQELFTPDGWNWNINSDVTKELLKKVRYELYELFGEGEYMHVGCDEAYFYTFCDEERKKLPKFLNELTSQVVAEGRRPMVWMDMMLPRDTFEKITASCRPEEVEMMQKSLHPATVMVDWQYRTSETPIPTMMSLKDTGYDVMGAPWHVKSNYQAYIDTIRENNFFGLMMTTWHTLHDRMVSVRTCASLLGASLHTWSEASGIGSTEAATIWRRVSYEGSDFKSAGWQEIDILDYHIGT